MSDFSKTWGHIFLGLFCAVMVVVALAIPFCVGGNYERNHDPRGYKASAVKTAYGNGYHKGYVDRASNNDYNEDPTAEKPCHGGCCK